MPALPNTPRASLRQALQSAGYRSFRALCKQTGLSHATLHRFLRGELGQDARSKAFVANLARALNLSAPMLRARVAAGVVERKASEVRA